MVVIPPFVLVLPRFYSILCEGGIEIVRIGRSHDCEAYGHQKERFGVLLSYFCSGRYWQHPSREASPPDPRWSHS